MPHCMLERSEPGMYTVWPVSDALVNKHVSHKGAGRTKTQWYDNAGLAVRAERPEGDE
jgi:hypothetical protein